MNKKIAVIYKSMTGHSKKLARAVAAEFSIEAQNIKSKPQLKDVDLLFVAGGIYAGKSTSDMLDYIKTLNSNSVKKAVLITSSTSDKTGQEDVRKILETNNVEVVGEYRCRGNFIFFKMGHPNKDEVAGAVEFAKQLGKKL